MKIDQHFINEMPSKRRRTDFAMKTFPEEELCLCRKDNDDHIGKKASADGITFSTVAVTPARESSQHGDLTGTPSSSASSFLENGDFNSGFIPTVASRSSTVVKKRSRDIFETPTVSTSTASHHRRTLFTPPSLSILSPPPINVGKQDRYRYHEIKAVDDSSAIHLPSLDIDDGEYDLQQVDLSFARQLTMKRTDESLFFRALLGLNL
jgi:hypothetical protein